MIKDYSSLDYKGKTLTLMQDAYLDGDCDGNGYYTAHAIDDDDNDYQIFWEIINHDCEDQSSACDWNDYSIN